MDIKTSFFEVMSEAQKDPEDVSTGIGKIYKVLNKFSCNLRSKSARSTLTSPSPIRINPSRSCHFHSDMRYCEIRKEMVLLYFGLDVFCQFEARFIESVQ